MRDQCIESYHLDSMIVSSKTQLPLALDGRQTRGPGAGGAHMASWHTGAP